MARLVQILIRSQVKSLGRCKGSPPLALDRLMRSTSDNVIGLHSLYFYLFFTTWRIAVLKSACILRSWFWPSASARTWRWRCQPWATTWTSSKPFFARRWSTDGPAVVRVIVVQRRTKPLTFRFWSCGRENPTKNPGCRGFCWGVLPSGAVPSGTSSLVTSLWTRLSFEGWVGRI